MQISEESQIIFDEEDQYRLNVIDSSIRELHKVIITIQNGIAEEMAKIKSIMAMLDYHTSVLKERQRDQIVSMAEIIKMRQDCRSYVNFLEIRRDTLNSLNKILNERLNQFDLLIKRRQSILEKYKPAQIFYFKKHE